MGPKATVPRVTGRRIARAQTATRALPKDSTPYASSDENEEYDEDEDMESETELQPEETELSPPEDSPSASKIIAATAEIKAQLAADDDEESDVGVLSEMEDDEMTQLEAEIAEESNIENGRIDFDDDEVTEYQDTANNRVETSSTGTKRASDDEDSTASRRKRRRTRVSPAASSEEEEEESDEEMTPTEFDEEAPAELDEETPAELDGEETDLPVAKHGKRPALPPPIPGWKVTTGRMLKFKADKKAEKKKRQQEGLSKAAATKKANMEKRLKQQEEDRQRKEAERKGTERQREEDKRKKLDDERQRQEAADRANEGDEIRAEDMDVDFEASVAAVRNNTAALATSLTAYSNSLVELADTVLNAGSQRFRARPTTGRRPEGPGEPRVDPVVPRGGPTDVPPPVKTAVDRETSVKKSAKDQTMCRVSASKDPDEPGCGKKPTSANPLVSCSYGGCKFRQFCNNCKEGNSTDKKRNKIGPTGVRSKGSWFCSRVCSERDEEAKKAMEEVEKDLDRDEDELGGPSGRGGDGRAEPEREHVSGHNGDAGEEDKVADKPKVTSTRKAAGGRCNKCTKKFAGPRKRMNCELDECPGGHNYCQTCANRQETWSGQWLMPPHYNKRWFCCKKCMQIWQGEHPKEGPGYEEEGVGDDEVGGGAANSKEKPKPKPKEKPKPKKKPKPTEARVTKPKAAGASTAKTKDTKGNGKAPEIEVEDDEDEEEEEEIVDADL